MSALPKMKLRVRDSEIQSIAKKISDAQKKINQIIASARADVEKQDKIANQMSGLLLKLIRSAKDDRLTRLVREALKKNSVYMGSLDSNLSDAIEQAGAGQVHPTPWPTEFQEDRCL